MFLCLVAIKVVTHFNNDDKGLKLYRQETQKIKIDNFFWGDIKYFARLKPILMRLPSQKQTQALLVIKKIWKSLIHIHIYVQLLGIKCLRERNMYVFCQGLDRKPGGEE